MCSSDHSTRSHCATRHDRLCNMPLGQSGRLGGARTVLLFAFALLALSVLASAPAGGQTDRAGFCEEWAKRFPNLPLPPGCEPPVITTPTTEPTTTTSTSTTTEPPTTTTTTSEPPATTTTTTAPPATTTTTTTTSEAPATTTTTTSTTAAPAPAPTTEAPATPTGSATPTSPPPTAAPATTAPPTTTSEPPTTTAAPTTTIPEATATADATTTTNAAVAVAADGSDLVAQPVALLSADAGAGDQGSSGVQPYVFAGLVVTNALVAVALVRRRRLHNPPIP